MFRHLGILYGEDAQKISLRGWKDGYLIFEDITFSKFVMGNNLEDQ